jgi:hypothetical protein
MGATASGPTDGCESGVAPAQNITRRALLTAGGAGVAVAPVAACARSVWRDLVADPGLTETVLAVDATTQELIWTLGPLICGILAAAIDPMAAVVTAAILTVVATTVYALTPAARGWRAQATHHRQRALSAPALPGLLASIALTGGCYGAVTVALPAISPQAAAGSLIAGLLLGLFSLSSLLGGWPTGHATGARRSQTAISDCCSQS